MKVTVKDKSEHHATNWGSIYKLLETEPILNNISICHIEINDLIYIAKALTQKVQNKSWMMSLDKGTRRQYEFTANETASELISIFNSPTDENEELTSEFGEVMVSISASEALSKMFEHISIPIAELWKPQKKQNEGFDFHTVCPDFLINFGEAKYSKNINPYSLSEEQTDDFFTVEKQYRDRTFLRDLVDEKAIANLDEDDYGAIIAFSINSSNIEEIFKNAILKVDTYNVLSKAKQIYIVGVSYDVN